MAYPVVHVSPILARHARRVGAGTLVANPFQIRRIASQTRPIQQCHPERSEGSLPGRRSFAALRMTLRDGLLFEMYCPLWSPARSLCGMYYLFRFATLVLPWMPRWLVLAVGRVIGL